MATLGRIIAGARIERGMTQEELADAIGVSKSAVCQWEAGRSTPRMHIRARIAKALGLETMVLLPEIELLPELDPPRTREQAIADIKARLAELEHDEHEGRGDAPDPYPGIEALLQDPTLRQALQITDAEAESLRSVSVGTDHSVETVDQAIALLALLRTLRRR
ncbi:MAG: helix-turn-helix transcriptional regulator [Veillonellaceae bacterium]|nr:helix-turn-helix transcriptional regulator [Veillonellaceae bacterium]